ncbi:hypothetical protein [Microbacterium sp. ZW T5_56]|uniref:hypothetical protein n=1 Tax=Microbacterium sp. ZW T5_56 TaxID=3378081 RepID=UPI0038555CA6
MTTARVFIVAPPLARDERSARFEVWRKAAQKLAEEADMAVTTYRLSEVNVRNEGNFLVMNGIDASKMYQMVHRVNCAVIQIGTDARVPFHPRDSCQKRNTMELEQFVRYKAVFAKVNGRVGPVDAIGAVSAQLTSLECDGERDPRCLPMHVFDPSHDHVACPLTDAVKVRARYQGPKIRTDGKSREWGPPKGIPHGSHELRVRGRVLRAGYHWDVKSAQNTSDLMTTLEIWSMPPGSYLNVSPDAHVRSGQSSAVSARLKYTLSAKKPDRSKQKRRGRPR